MKKLIVFTCLLSLLFSLNACSSYYYSMLSSDKGIVGVNEYNDFVQENDSVRIIYNFYGEDAPVRITVFNKLDEPMYIDWQRSSLIIGDKAVSYYKEVMPVQGDVESYSSSTRQYGSVSSYSRGSFIGEVQMSKGIEFIPPRSKIEASTLCLGRDFLDDIPYGAFMKRPFVKANGCRTNLKVMKFNVRNSPLYFRSYLTIYTGMEEHKSVYESSFYISELVDAGKMSPSGFRIGQDQAGNFSYYCNRRGMNTGWIIGYAAAGIAVVTSMILIFTHKPSMEMPSHF